jgi:hypothetical protein
MQIWLTIDPHGDGVLTFDPGKVLDRLAEYLPEADIDPIDYGWEEIEKITKLANEQCAEPTRSTIINQIVGKNRRNGPTYKFRIATREAAEINGHARRYSIRFACDKVFNAAAEKKIIEFLKSLKYGEISSDTKTEYFCVPDEPSNTKWFLQV